MILLAGGSLKLEIVLVSWKSSLRKIKKKGGETNGDLESSSKNTE
jgi:hypothetical protein